MGSSMQIVKYTSNGIFNRSGSEIHIENAFM